MCILIIPAEIICWVCMSGYIMEALPMPNEVNNLQSTTALPMIKADAAHPSAARHFQGLLTHSPQKLALMTSRSSHLAFVKGEHL